MKFARCSESLYYDLIRIPHGHIPAPKANFWSWLPIPVRGYRDYSTFFCPSCGKPSFFKIWDMCMECERDGGWRRYDAEKAKKKHKREKWRKRWKALEYALLPLLVLFGKASYIRTTRIHTRDLQQFGGNLTDELRTEINAEKRKKLEKSQRYW